MISKKRKEYIKQTLRNHIKDIETLRLLREEIDVFNRLEKEGQVFDVTEKQKLVNKLKEQKRLLEKIGLLEVGIRLLNVKEWEKDKEILEHIYLYGYSITKTANLLGYVDKGIEKRLEKIYEKLDEFIR